MNVTLRDYVQFVVGRYFYARRPADIPLTGQVQGTAVTFKEPGGGVFRLHLVSMDPTSRPPLTFYNSIRREGRGRNQRPMTSS